MNETSDEVMALSDVDAGDADEGTVSPTPVTVPKKRGRPSNAEKPKKAASITGRGRGRPAKGAEAGNKKVVKTTSDGSDEEGTGSEDASPAFNGDSADGEAAVPSKRGRKPKAKRKLANSVESTGKGRGRPKKVAKLDDGDDDDEAADDDDDGASNDHKSGKKLAAKGAKKGRGRPKKVNNSDDESSDDKEETRPVGRPPSGGINLNIIRTGRGQGRPKIKRLAESAKGIVNVENNDGLTSNKRGRPSTSGKGAYIPTGKPRGRPKAVKDNDSQNEDGDSEVNWGEVDSSVDEVNEEKSDDKSVDQL